MKEFDHLRLDRQGRTAVLSLHRPEALNALNRRTMEELKEAFAHLAENPEVGAVVLTGSGEKSFAAGADIRELAALDPLEAREQALFGQSVLSAIQAMPKPVLAAVNGFCLGGGCELALACHLRIASENARFGLPEVKLGLIPGYGGTQRLSRLIGPARALELILSGEMIEAAEAVRIGLANRVVPLSELLPTALELAASILKNGPLAVRYALEAVRSGSDMPLTEALSLEAGLFGLGFASRDAAEGLRAFLEKRPPSFRGK